MEKVVVVILNFKVKDLTLKCIKSVQKSSYKNLGIIVVDNNSDDGLEDALKDYPDIDFIQTKQNLGFTGGNNAGIKKALKEKCDLVFILNPDTIIETDTISKLVEGLKNHNAGIVGPKIYFTDSKKIWFAGGILDKANVLGSHKGVDEIDKGQFNKDEETDYITGAAMLVKKEVFERIGLLDEKFFLYYEDSDFCLRAKRAGFKVYFIHDAIVYHKNAQSTGLGSPLQDYYITRNRMLLASKFLSMRTQLALFREALRNIKNPIRRKAFLDFELGRFGKGI